VLALEVLVFPGRRLGTDHESSFGSREAKEKRGHLASVAVERETGEEEVVVVDEAPDRSQLAEKASL
jgi:hypothetical protein